MEKKRIGILGSTGSIGTQTLDIISEYPEQFEAVLLTAYGNWELLAKQALKYRPRRVVIVDDRHYAKLSEALSGSGIEVASGEKALVEAMEMPELQMVVTATVGYSGLAPTIAAVKRGLVIALANKETLVVGGEIIDRLVKEYHTRIIPVDSEHSAIFQCLQGELSEEAEKIILTASGGPFRKLSLQEMEHVTAADALKHPNWSMGAKVTIDSASMMNKGFEMIEARWLFGCPPDKIEITVHPQSIVHSMVQFTDGSIKAQLGVPDMHLPIRYALSWPHRLITKQKPLQLSQYKELTFEAPDMERFPLLGYAFDAISQGGSMPCILNAANEIAVAAFLRGEIRFVDMPKLVAQTMRETAFTPSIDYQALVDTNTEARAVASSLINKYR